MGGIPTSPAPSRMRHVGHHGNPHAHGGHGGKRRHVGQEVRWDTRASVSSHEVNVDSTAYPGWEDRMSTEV